MFKSAAYTTALDALNAPMLCVHGDQDQFTSASSYAARFAGFESGERKVVVIEGGDHFWRGEAQREAMIAAVAEWV